MPKETKASALEKERRLFTIQGWIIDGVADYLIKKQIMDNWELSNSQARRYIKEAFVRWEPDEEISIESRRSARIADLKNKIREMDPKFKRTPEGLKTELAYAKEISKLEALYPIRKLEISGDQQNPVVVKTSPFLTEEQEKDFQEYLQKKYKFKVD